MKQKQNEFGYYFWVHLGIIFFLDFSPFMWNWKLVIVIAVLYFLQILILGDCILTLKQFKGQKRQHNFHHHYLSKLGLQLDKEKLMFITDWTIPLVIIALAIIFQLGFGMSPLFY